VESFGVFVDADDDEDSKHDSADKQQYWRRPPMMLFDSRANTYTTITGRIPR